MYRKYLKRACDILLALMLFVIFSWLIVIILLVYFLLRQFPIVFKQERIGKGNSVFTIYKFRTLSESHLLSNEQRRFWWGDVLRFLSLDEILQLWNVLKGDMSLIGPRPLPTEYLPLYTENEKRRHEVRPGITGWAQVNGRNSISWKEKFELDLYYVNHLSFKLDLLIFVKTLQIWFSFHKDISLAEEKFKGTENRKRATNE